MSAECLLAVGPKVQLAGEHGNGCRDLLVAAAGLEVEGYATVDLCEDVHEVLLGGQFPRCVHKGLDEPGPVLRVSPGHIAGGKSRSETAGC